MSDYGSIGDAAVSLFRAAVIVLAIFVPLGIWKLVEIAMYLYEHISWSWT